MWTVRDTLCLFTTVARLRLDALDASRLTRCTQSQPSAWRLRCVCVTSRMASPAAIASCAARAWSFREPARAHAAPCTVVIARGSLPPTARAHRPRLGNATAPRTRCRIPFRLFRCVLRHRSVRAALRVAWNGCVEQWEIRTPHSAQHRQVRAGARWHACAIAGTPTLIRKERVQTRQVVGPRQQDRCGGRLEVRTVRARGEGVGNSAEFSRAVHGVSASGSALPLPAARFPRLPHATSAHGHALGRDGLSVRVAVGHGQHVV